MFSSAPRKRTVAVGAVGIAVIAAVAITGVVVADAGEGGGAQPPAPAGTPISDDSQLTAEFAGQIENIITNENPFGNPVYDPTILTKFISGRGFVANQGPDGGVDDDRILPNGTTCVSPATVPGGEPTTDLFASVELPKGARIKQIAFFGRDSDVNNNITIRLFRNQTRVPSGVIEETLVDSFSTTGFLVGGLSGADNLEEITGILGPFPSGNGYIHQFYFIDVTMQDVAALDQALCGVEVHYQVPISAADPGTVFHPITPVRAYDSRLAGYPVNGPIANNTSRVIDISSGHDLATGAITLANAVPAGATAITFNLTTSESTATGFVAVVPGDAATFAASTLNLNGTPLANGGTVAIAGDRTIKAFVGGGGSTQVIVDVTGYYAPPVPLPNMGN